MKQVDRSPSMNALRLTLRQLQIFRVVAESGSTAAAAAAISLSQSATSAAINELERTLELQLFDRIGKRLQLNDNGRALLPQTLALLDGAGWIERWALDRESHIGTLRIGASTTIGNYLLPAILAGFRSAELAGPGGYCQHGGRREERRGLRVGSRPDRRTLSRARADRATVARGRVGRRGRRPRSDPASRAQRPHLARDLEQGNLAAARGRLRHTRNHQPAAHPAPAPPAARHPVRQSRGDQARRGQRP